MEDFLTALLLQILFPLIPLGLELWQKHTLSSSTTSLVVAMYAITIGVSSTSKFLFACGIGMGLVFSVVYGGLLAPNPADFAHSGLAAEICIGFVAAYHSVERYVIHVMRKKPFSILDK